MSQELPPPEIRRPMRRPLTVECVVCRRISESRWCGWGAYRVDEPGVDAEPELAFYCPACRREQFSHI
jgi:hypothetical protein